MNVKTLKIENHITKYPIWPSIRKKAVKIMLLMFIRNFIKNKIHPPNMMFYLIGQKILRDEENFWKTRKSLCLQESFLKKNEDLNLHHLVINLSSMLELKVPLKVLNILFRKMKNIVSLLTKQNGKEIKQLDTNMIKNIINLIQIQKLQKCGNKVIILKINVLIRLQKIKLSQLLVNMKI